MPDLTSSLGTFFDFSFDQPIITTAIHNGHQISDRVAQSIGISDDLRFKDEDPFTEFFATLNSNRVIQIDSRFEYDINRHPDKCVYDSPDLAFGLPIYPNGFPKEIKPFAIQKYRAFYDHFECLLKQMLEKYSKIIVWDIHSFNLNSKSEENRPLLNMGTSNIQPHWNDLTHQLTLHFSKQKLNNNLIDFKVNKPFPGGYFPQWINHFYGDRVCAVSMEFGKYFMDENSGKLFIDKSYLIRDLFYSSFPIINDFLCIS